MEAARASAGRDVAAVGVANQAVAPGAKGNLPPRQSRGDQSQKSIPPRPNPYPLDRKSLGGMDVDAYTLGGKGWIEYRKAGGKVYYARDRWYERDAGKWVKHSKNRPDLRILSGDEYGQWKAKRAAARERRRNRARTHDVRQVVIE